MISISFNPASEPNDDWPYKFDDSPALEKSGANIFSIETTNNPSPGESGNGDSDFTFPSGPEAAEDDDEVTELKIRAFLDEKPLDLKKLQSPLYEEFYNSLNASIPSSAVGTEDNENSSHDLNLPPKSRSPNRAPSRRLSAAVDAASPRSPSKRVPKVGSLVYQTLQEVNSLSHGEMKEDLLDSSASFSERQRKWKEELDEELERKREMMHHAGVVQTSSPKDRNVSRQRDRFGFAFPGK